MALDTRQEHHIRISEHKNGERINLLYYHRECWKEIMTGKATLHNLQGEANKLMGTVKKMLGTKEEYEIK